MIKVYRGPEQIAIAAGLILFHELHRTTKSDPDSFGSCMKNWSRKETNIQKIILYFINDVPVASFIKLKEKEDTFNCGTFVKPEYRRQGIGVKLIEAAVKDKSILHVWTGRENSYKFYNSEIVAKILRKELR